jgi:hypothetical protein
VERNTADLKWSVAGANLDGSGLSRSTPVTATRMKCLCVDGSNARVVVGFRDGSTYRLYYGASGSIPATLTLGVPLSFDPWAITWDGARSRYLVADGDSNAIFVYNYSFVYVKTISLQNRAMYMSTVDNANCLYYAPGNAGAYRLDLTTDIDVSIGSGSGVDKSGIDVYF